MTTGQPKPCVDREVVVRQDLPRKDSVAKVTGIARYTNDVSLPGMLHAKVLRSPHAHARVLSTDAERARRVSGVAAVVTRDDLKGLNATYGYFIKDQPIVAIDKVRYVGDIVAAVAAVDERTALEAAELISVEYELLPAVTTVDAALDAGAPALFEEPQPGVVPAYGAGASATKEPRKNVCYQFNYATGDPGLFDYCEHVFEDTFTYSSSQHFHLEPFVAVAQVVGGTIEVWSSTQNPFPLRKEIARIFNRPEHLVRVHVPLVGGGFGAKNNCKTEPVAILLAQLTGRPVRFCLSAEEGFLTQRQHNARIDLRTGVTSDGTLVARKSHVYLDSGAYSDGSPLVAEKAGYRVAGPYNWGHVESHAYCVMTNTTPAGPFRGFGGTQVGWASESQIDMIARRLGMDPYDLRKKNLIPLGQPFMPGESGIDSDLKGGLDVVVQELGYHGRGRRRGRGMGLSVGFKDGGGVNKPARARIKVTTSGQALLSCGTIEIGQGATTALTQIAAEILRVPHEWVSYAPVNTDTTPFDQGTNASSSIAVMGKAVESAAHEARRQALNFAADQLRCEPGELALKNWLVRRGDEEQSMASLVLKEFGGTGFEFVGDGYFKAPTSGEAPLHTPCVFWEIGWGGAEVEVDEETGAVHILRLIVSSDVGRAINPGVCRGQEEGAAIMGLGQAMFERLVYEGGRLKTNDPLHYRVPMAADLPDDFRSVVQEQGHGPGPFGAKGVAEAGILVVASAVANAVEDAVGARVTELPMTPERVVAALAKRRSEDGRVQDGGGGV
jgi:CO/xanthine dehydrogenase Mo-binding subunit